MAVSDLLTELGLIDNAINRLQVNTAVEWLQLHTTLEINIDDVVSMPNRAKLFIAKFTEVFKKPSGVASESMEGLSQSFTSDDVESTLYSLAEALLGSDLKSTTTVFSGESRWVNEC